MNCLPTVAFAVCLALIFAGTEAVGQDRRDPLREIDGVESLLSKNPDALAKEVIRSGQIQFLGIAGFAVSAPGIDSDRCVAEPARVYVVSGTSDVLTDAQIARQSKAEAFANRYNKIIREHLVKQGLLQSFLVCTSPEPRAK